MFCKNCGTEMSEGSLFCPKCGTSVDASSKSPMDKREKMKIETSTIIVILISMVMLLSMIFLPMFDLAEQKVRMTGGEYETYNEHYYTISFLGDNDIAYDGSRDGIVSFSRIAFILVAASLAAGILFKITNKKSLGVVCAAFDLGVLISYFMYVSNAWNKGSSSYNTYVTLYNSGYILCFICAFALGTTFLALLAYSMISPDNSK